MNKQAVFSHFSQILDNMLDDSLFFCTYFQAPCYLEDITGSIDDPNIPENIHLYFGATRGCILDENYEYVVKFDVDSDISGESICEREHEIYTRARTQNFSKYFAPCYYLGTYTKEIQFYDYGDIECYMDWCDYDRIEFEEEFMKHENEFGEIQTITIYIPLYAYPKATYDFPRVPKKEDEVYETIARSINSPLKSRSFYMAVTFAREYGEEEYQRFSSFLYDEGINDLHNGNFGMIDSHFVIIDYAGYHDGDTREDSYYNE